MENLLKELVYGDDLLYKIGPLGEFYIYEVDNIDASIYKGSMELFITEFMEHLGIDNAEDLDVIKKYNL